MPKSLNRLPALDTLPCPAEWPVLLESASPHPDPQRLTTLLTGVDWPRLLFLAEEHGVTTLLGASLRSLEGIPLEIRGALSERQRTQIFFSLRLTAELFRVLDIFKSAGVEAVVVKGPALAMQAYGDPAMRSYGDLDLLIRHRDIRRATELMMASGFTAAVPLSAIDAGKIPGQYLFSNTESRLLIEFHNDRTLRYFPRPLPLEDFFARRISICLDSHDVPALSVEDELVLICIHGAKHFWERLMWIADVAALITRHRNVDWDRSEKSAQAVGAQRMLHTGLGLALRLLGAALPKNVQAIVEGDAAAAQLAQQANEWLATAGNAAPGLFERALFRLRMRGSFVAAPAYLFRLSFSPTEEDWHEAGGSSGKPFMEALRRPFRLARKYGRSDKR
jgi:hypothetical protein